MIPTTNDTNTGCAATPMNSRGIARRRCRRGHGACSEHSDLIVVIDPVQVAPECPKLLLLLRSLQHGQRGMSQWRSVKIVQSPPRGPWLLVPFAAASCARAPSLLRAPPPDDRHQVRKWKQACGNDLPLSLCPP